MGLTLIAALLASARPAASPDEAAIRAQYKAFDDAFEKQDLAAIEPLFAADYVATLDDGSTNGRDEALSDIQEEATSALPPIHCKEQLGRIAIDGAGAKVQVAEETSYQVRGSDGRLHAYRYTESYDDTLAKVDGQWLFRATHYGAGGQEQLDGKPVPRGGLKKLLAAAGGDDPRLRGLYAAADAAFEKRDLAGLLAAYDSEWTVSGSAGAVTHGAAVASLKREVEAALPPVRRHTALEKVSFGDGTATAQLTCETGYGVRAADGKTHALKYSQPLEDRLIEVDGHWRVRATRMLEGGEVTFDGRTSTRDEIKQLLGQ